jgi:PEP-CTERM motif
MKRAILLSAALVLFATVGARAQVTTLDDPLHGFCSAGCTDNGTNTPIGSNPPVSWGFQASPAPQTGTYIIDILTPNSSPAIASIGITGAQAATATLFSPTAWTSGDLATYLGITASPANPIGAYLPSTVVLAPGTTGFFVDQANLGTHTLQGTNVTPPELFNLASGIPKGSYIVAFLLESSGNVATANSGALFETASAVPEPATWGMMLLGFIGLGFAFRQSRRKVSLA